MLTLNDGRDELWQWDTGRNLTVDADCSQVHFSNKVFGRSVDVDVVDGVASIPDILLQTDKELMAWAFVGTAENGYTKISKVFKVNKRNKPADYVFTEPDQTTLGEILNRIEDLENKPSADISKEDIQDAVNEYLDNNPVSIDEKDPTVPDWAKQPEPPKVKIPDTLPNPHKLTFSGAVSAEYDGSKAVEVVIPQSGGGDAIEEVYELIANTTIEEAVSQWEYNFKDKPMKKIWVYIKTPAHTADTNYASITVSTDVGGAHHFRSKAPYIYPVPRKNICEQDITVEVRELNGTYALVFENSLRNGQPLSAWENGRFVGFGPDNYGNPLNGQMTSVHLNTYQIFDVGAEIRLWGVRA